MRTMRAGLAGCFVLALACSEGTDPTSTTTTMEDLAAGDPGVAASSAPRAYGVDAENYLVFFRLDRPGQGSRRTRITGTGGRKVVGIDFRPSAVAPATSDVVGKLYGLTKTMVFEIDPETGAASNGRALTVPLVGSSFGAGFNPTVDRLRSHGNGTQNVRLNVADGVATLDTALAYIAGDPGFGTEPSIAGTAYTNSDNDPATLTVLYAIDARRDALVVLPTPNGGQLTTVGRLGVPTTNFVGFDIPGQTGQTFGFASLQDPSRRNSQWNWGQNGRGGSTLYRVDIGTGTASLVGDIGNRAPLVSIAVAP